MFNASTTPPKEMRRDRLSSSLSQGPSPVHSLRFCAMGRVPCWRRPSRRKSLTFRGRYAVSKIEAGHQRVVRHGHLPEREIMTGIGSVSAREPRVRDQGVSGFRQPERWWKRTRATQVPTVNSRYSWLAVYEWNYRPRCECHAGNS